MTPDRYEVAPAGRHRLSGVIQKRGSKMGMSTLGGSLFGGVFAAAGAAVTLIGVKIIPVSPASVHAPYWTLTAFGASFALSGLWVWGVVWKQFAASRRRIDAARRYPGEPALGDYPWHPDGCDVSEWPALAKAVVMAVFLTIFLSMFNWWAFGEKGPTMVKVIVIIFDCVLLFVWGQAVRQLGRALKFGHSRIDFTTFPFRPGQPALLRWHPFRGIQHVNNGTFKLRCVQEWVERSGSGRNQNVAVVHEEIWSAQWLLEQPRNLPLLERVELRYELPADALPTQFGADKPIFWELEVKLNLPGLDFDETYLVPVYGPA